MDDQRVPVREIVLKVLLLAAFVVAASHAAAFAARSLGIGDVFKSACAAAGYRQAVEDAQIVVVGASDAVAVDPNLLGVPAGVVTAKGAGVSALVLTAELVLRQQDALTELVLVINPVSLLADVDHGIRHLVNLFGFDMVLALARTNPQRYFSKIIESVLRTDIWWSTLSSARDLSFGRTESRCRAIRARNGIEFIIPGQETLAESARKDARLHGRRLDAAAEAAILEDNLERLRSLQAVAGAEGVRLTIVLPPLYRDYRKLMGIDALAARPASASEPGIIDLTAAYDDDEGLFLNATHVDWPAGTEVVTARVLGLLAAPAR